MFKAILIAVTAVNAIKLQVEETATTLRAAGLNKGIFVGAEFNTKYLEEPNYAEVHAREYSISTAENACKMKQIQKKKGVFSLDRCISALQHAVNSDQKFRGHALIWNTKNPDWLVDGDYDSDELTAIMKEHIFTVMQGVVVGDTKPYCWDVINEAIGWESHYDNDSLTGRNGLKDGNWYPAMPNYVDQAYIFAREADPDALLFYNDYQLVFKEQRGQAVYSMVKGMIEREVPIDGIAMQMHYQSEDEVNSREEISDMIALFGSLGVQVHISEMTVSCEDCEWSNEAQLKQAEGFQNALGACLDNPGVCTAFLTWGFTDLYTNDTNDVVFDRDYEKKPAYDSMLEILNE